MFSMKMSKLLRSDLYVQPTPVMIKDYSYHNKSLNNDLESNTLAVQQIEASEALFDFLFFSLSIPNDTVASPYPMAPPIKYKTNVAKLQAMKAKCSRYYAKCREEILAKRREKYHINKNRQKDDDGSDNKHTGDDLDKGGDECRYIS
ncbi:uncharacterized protein F5147DRAFT_654655 [Suillus discolor]|uniref:Uncharacterized protein n=1 Tax=Suillus discolor TaxID=1912936 RepID=A0A9P7F291_9AGAM|nr:uncharacterized protein F5147DRAFT_654655 [Suillus discolor]KAG2103748.1 hypothetical protein F5147DRAFT_654655 [Suillus discolor]